MEPKVANVGQGLVSAGLGLQWRMGLLEKHADPTLYGVVGRVGVRPGKAMAMDVLTGHKQLRSGLLSLCLPRQASTRGFAGFEV